jgi:hypothetical protein
MKGLNDGGWGGGRGREFREKEKLFSLSFASFTTSPITLVLRGLCFECRLFFVVANFKTAFEPRMPGGNETREVLEQVIKVVCAVQGLKCRLCLVFQSLNRVCQDKAMVKRLELCINGVYTVLKCRLCFGFQSLNRVCQDSETREVLERVSKQVVVLQQSAARVASSSEQFGAVQQVTNGEVVFVLV